MMTKIKFMGLAALLTVSMSMIAQDKLFTLEDLNYGGTNYRRMLPKNVYITWWGDQLMYQDAEEGGTIAQDKSRTALFTLDEVNATLKAEPSSMHSASIASRSRAPLMTLP